MVIDTKPFGRISIDPRQIMEFPSGLYGFETHRQFALMDSNRPPFYWLQSLVEAEIAFVLVNPYLVRRDYVLDLAPQDLDSIGDPDAEDLLVFAVVTIPDDPTLISCNLQGPLIVNRASRVGRQAISLDERWKTKHYIMREAQTAG